MKATLRRQVPGVYLPCPRDSLSYANNYHNSCYFLVMALLKSQCFIVLPLPFLLAIAFELHCVHQASQVIIMKIIGSNDVG